MQVCYPEFDFKNSTALWADNVEVVIAINAGAIVPTPIERYMIRAEKSLVFLSRLDVREPGTHQATALPW